MKSKVFLCGIILLITVVITLYICNKDLYKKVGVLKSGFSKKSLKSREHNGNFYEEKSSKQSENTIGLKRTADHEVTAEELEEFHSGVDEKDESEELEEKEKNSQKELLALETKHIERKGEFKKRFPQVIIAGVKKCGTRALLSFLAKHPLVKSAGREMHFFDKNDTYSKGLSWYREQMPESYENEITIEKTPGYYVKKYVPKRIHDMSKDIKLIFIYKDPVERAISDYAQTLANKEKSVRFERLIYKKKGQKEVNGNKSIVSIGLYEQHLWNWLEYFPKINMLFVDGDSFIKNPVPAMIEVQNFLKLPILINEQNFVYNSTKRFYCFRKLNEERQIEEHCLGESKGRKHPKIKKMTRKRLTDFYRIHNQKFFDIIKKDFGWPTPAKDENDEDE